MRIITPKITNHLKLMKVRLSLLITISACFGYLLHSPEISGSIITLFPAIFFLTSGSAICNNYQDRYYDQHFARTRQRPFPAQQVNHRSALLQASLFISLGIFLLYLITSTWLPPLLGISAVILYNGFYTPLKTKTILAIIPGALCGAIPPWIGWLVANGPLLSPTIALVMTIIGVWQFPHFWIVLLNQKREYSQQEKLPSMLQFFQEAQLKRIIFQWVFAFALLPLLLPLTEITKTTPISYLLLLNSLAVTSIFFFRLFLSQTEAVYRSLFLWLNLSLTLFMVIVSLERTLPVYI